jgi:curved DNA-binding protein CbpA
MRKPRWVLQVLGVSLDASADEIRAALRDRLATSQLHPDQGGDGKEATRLIAAKNLLIERLKAVWP